MPRNTPVRAEPWGAGRGRCCGECSAGGAIRWAWEAAPSDPAQSHTHSQPVSLQGGSPRHRRSFSFSPSAAKGLLLLGQQPTRRLFPCLMKVIIPFLWSILVSFCRKKITQMNHNDFYFTRLALSSLASLKNKALRQSLPVTGVAGVKGERKRSRKGGDKVKVLPRWSQLHKVTPASGSCGCLQKGHREPQYLRKDCFIISLC